MPTYTALRAIAAPGTTVFGYQRGHDVAPSVVENWGLVVGPDDGESDVMEGPLPADAGPAPLPSVPRPTDADNRATWEAWAIANGMDPAEAAEVSQEDLEAYEAPAPADAPERPADSAKKADWVAYALALGADEAWATADSTTKADLQAYQPEAGDTVAIAATEANNG